MNAERVTLDTNILVYAVDRDAGERHGMAADLVMQAAGWDCVLTLQALGEFFWATTRKGKMPIADARRSGGGLESPVFRSNSKPIDP